MLDGITILNEFEVADATSFSWTSFSNGAIVGVIISLLIVVFIALDLGFEWRAFCVTSTILGLFCGLLAGIIAGKVFPTVNSYKTHYEVTISENVSLDEFYSRYDIIEKRGDIYTIVERGDAHVD